MLKRPKIKIIILLISIIIIGGYFFISSLIDNPKFSNLKSFLNVEQKELIKKYIFPYKFISQQQQIISQQLQRISTQKQKISTQQQTISTQQQQLQILRFVDLSVMELAKKTYRSEITTGGSIIKLSNNKELKKYNLN